MPKQVQLSDDAYATLTALKLPGESFSDVVRRLAAKKDVKALRQLGPRIPGWDDARFHRKAAQADRRRLQRLLGERGRRGRSR
ncbi:MAG: antitoxin VapB family protein [Euryarchaeota archaeon]|nr:antitoxin VapB family protein [Euryarchaeota archaeon]